ncbi:lytic transglycosylase domain-containing protein [Aminobacter sp. HY435]|uniref:lytic transglycosylase domain-containing protein n=1 Tax=Aminobacter sp. HY435 TaxID=2970917 RepID=UPI0022B99977|nr:transglycosylase SLT domain-containing protein [Aminobacter sp. HY435]
MLPVAAASASVIEFSLGRADQPQQRVETECGQLDAGSGRQAYRAVASCEARARKLPAEFALAVMEIESRYDPEARGEAGEVGLMQVMPATARLMGFRGTPDELAAPRTNIVFGVRYLADAFRLAGGDLCTTVMKYRAGHAQTRFSALSVRYCLRARAILRRDGYQVTGSVPEATFGFAAVAGLGEVTATGSATPKGVCIRRSFVPGPRYMRCAEYRPAAQARHIRSLRARLFGG